MDFSGDLANPKDGSKHNASGSNAEIIMDMSGEALPGPYGYEPLVLNANTANFF